jgi:hypothetical protein
VQKPDHVDIEFPITSTAIAGVIFCPKELAGGFSYSTSAGSRNTLTKGFTFDLCNVAESVFDMTAAVQTRFRPYQRLLREAMAPLLPRKVLDPLRMFPVSDDETD